MTVSANRAEQNRAVQEAKNSSFGVSCLHVDRLIFYARGLGRCLAARMLGWGSGNGSPVTVEAAIEPL